jgi:hypothetical protein
MDGYILKKFRCPLNLFFKACIKIFMVRILEMLEVEIGVVLCCRRTHGREPLDELLSGAWESVAGRRVSLRSFLRGLIMSFEQLSECIWYVEAGPWEKQQDGTLQRASRGSAVAVELLLHQSNQEVPTARKFLLTCGHVVREFAPKEETPPGKEPPPLQGWGKARDEIRCYRHGSGYTPTHLLKEGSDSYHGFAAHVHELSRHGLDAVPAKERIDFNDWVLLVVEDERFQAQPAVPLWGTVQDDEERLSALGFPGGAGVREAITASGLECTRSEGFRRRGGPAGVLSLNGPDKTLPGMSGCGYFSEKTGAFAGLHRAVDKPRKIFYAVPSVEIAEHLERLGVKPASHNPASSPGLASQPTPAPGSTGRAIILVFALLILAACLIALFQPRTVPIKATALRYTGIPTHYPPIRNAEVILQNDSRMETLRTKTNESGEFQFDLPAQAIGETWKISFPEQGAELSQQWEKERSSYIFHVRPKGGHDD